MSVGIVITIVIIFILIICFIAIGYFANKNDSRPNHHFRKPETFYGPHCFLDHPDFEYESRGIYGELDRYYYIARITRRNKEISIIESLIPKFDFDIMQTQSRSYEYLYTHHDEDFFSTNFKFNLKMAEISLKPTRFKLQLADNGFISHDNTFILASYVIMNMKGWIATNMGKMEHVENFWISHEWGQIPSGKYTQENLYLDLENQTNIVINKTRNLDKKYISVTTQKLNGMRQELKDIKFNEFDNRYMSQQGNFALELIPICRSNIYQVKLVDGQGQIIFGTAYRESFEI